MQKTWLITGAERGLGAAIAEAALRAGDSVVAAGHGLAVGADRHGPDRGRLLRLELDVNSESQAKRVVETAVARFGGIDVLVNGAALNPRANGPDDGVADHAGTSLGIRLFGVFNLTRTVLPLLRAARHGHIVNLSAPRGLHAAPRGEPDDPIRFALDGFSESLACELAPLGIHVTVVEPQRSASDARAPGASPAQAGTGADADRWRRRGDAAERDDGTGVAPTLAESIVELARAAQPPLRFGGHPAGLEARRPIGGGPLHALGPGPTRAAVAAEAERGR